MNDLKAKIKTMFMYDDEVAKVGEFKSMMEKALLFDEKGYVTRKVNMRLIRARATVLPCPQCGYLHPKFTYSIKYGHGDSTYSDARIKCPECKLSVGDRGGWGSPGEHEEIAAYKHWNEVVLNLKKQL